MCLSKFLTGAPPVGVHASVRGGAERTEDGERRSAVNQCWMSKELMEAAGKTLGGMEPCTIQASFRWSATAGAKHPESSATQLRGSRGDCICIRGGLSQIRACGRQGEVMSSQNVSFKVEETNRTLGGAKQISGRSCNHICR